MDADRFVDGIYKAVYRTTIDGVAKIVRDAPGRRPRPALVSLGDWFNRLDEQNVEQVEEVIRLSVDQAVFGLLAVLDGSRAIDNQGTDLSLTAHGEVINGGDLHDRFRLLVDQELGRE